MNATRRIVFLGILITLAVQSQAQLAPVITTQSSGQTTGIGGTAMFSVTVSGFPPFTYQWRHNGTNLPGIIKTVAGNGNTAYTGNGGPATNAALSNVQGATMDSLGNIYIADTYNYVIRRVGSNGIITTVAGNHTSGYTGDGAAAAAGELSLPTGVAADSAGNLYLADFSNGALRKVNTSGTLSTFAGGFFRPFGVAVGPPGEFFVSDLGNQQVYKLNAAGSITVFAGSGHQGYTGDGGPATSAKLSNPAGVAVDQLGRLLIADSGNNVIRMVGLDGTITTVAGNATPGFSGDGGAATNAQLNTPTAVAVEPNGALLIADSANNRVREISPAGIITTLAGTGVAAFGGDGGPATAASFNQPYSVWADASGNVVIADCQNSRVRMIPSVGPVLNLANASVANGGTYDVVVANAFGSVTSSVATLTIDSPVQITTQPRNLTPGFGADVSFAVVATGTPPPTYQWYASSAADTATGTVTVNGGVVTGLTLTSGGAGYLSAPQVQIVGGYGRGATAVAEVQNGSVTALEVTDGGSNYTNQPVEVVIAPPTPSALAGETNATLDLAGVGPSDDGVYEVVVANSFGSVTSSVASLTVQLSPQFTVDPRSLTIEAGGSAAFVATVEGAPPLTYRWYLNGSPLSDGNGITGSETNALNLAAAAASNAGGYELLVTNAYGSATSSVAVLDVGYPVVITTQPASTNVPPGGTILLSVATSGTGPLSYQWQFDGSNISGGLIFTIAGNGASSYSGNGGAATNAGINQPQSLALDQAGNLYIADTGHHAVRKIDRQGDITTVAGTGAPGFSGDGGFATNAQLNTPTGVAADGNGNLFIAEFGNDRVRLVNANGIISTIAGNGTQGYSGDDGPAISASLNRPASVALDAAGNIYIADELNYRVRKVGTNGNISTVAGNGLQGYSGNFGTATSAKLNNPAGLAFDSFGRLYIADSGNNAIERVDPNGAITTVAGNTLSGFSGDDGPATSAQLNIPTGVSFDAGGALLISDWGNNRVRRVDTNGIITTICGNGTAGFYGDGGAALNAGLNQPYAVLGDNSGNIFIADWVNNRVREIPIFGATLTVYGAAPVNAGDYDVIVTGFYGSVTSSVVVLTVGVPPAITGQPSSKSVPLGSNATFSVTATGTSPLSYQWYASTLADTATAGATVNGGAVPGLTLTSGGAGYLTAPVVQILGGGGQGATAVAEVQNGTVTGLNLTAGGSGYTNPPTITIAPPPMSALSGGTNSTLVLGAVGAGDGGLYEVVVTNFSGSVTSSIATLTVELAPTFATEPRSLSAPAGSPATFVATVDGEPPLTYQWYLNGSPVSDGNGVTGSETNSLGIAAASSINAGAYELVVANAYGSATSSIAVFVVGYPPAITTQPASTNVLAGETVMLSITNSGAGPFSYQWQFDGSNLAGGLIFTIAGDGPATYAGDGGAATNAGLSQPQSLALDGAGNLYIADTYHHAVRKVDLNGIITTVAGGNGQGYSGDGHPATNAMLSYPIGIALDASNNLFIADYANNRVRKVSLNGIISTVAGTGSGSYSGDGGAATNAGLSNPSAVAFDSAGNLYVSDSSDYRIRKMDTNGIITTFAGNGQQAYAGDGGPATAAGLSNPAGLAFDSLGRLYIADSGNSGIRRIALDGTISMVAGNAVGGFSGDGGLATNAQLNTPTAVSFDSDGAMLISDWRNSRVRRVDTNGIMTTICGNGTAGFSGDGGVATGAELNQPYAVLGDSYGNVFIADWGNNRVRKIPAFGTTLTIGNASSANAGDYDVIVTGPYGSVTSSVAVLTVSFPVVITTQPVSQTVEIGTNATLSVLTTGTAPISYQWFASTVANTATATPILINGFVVGATVTTGGAGYLTPPLVQIAGGGGTGATATAMVGNGVVTGLRITDAGFGYTNPPAISMAAPPPLLLTGQTNAVLALNSISPGQAGEYLVVVANGYGSATSSVVNLTVLLQPAITLEPQNQYVVAGSNATMAAAAEGGGILGYQWYASQAQNTATAIPVVFDGFVVGTTVTSPGANYINPPAVSILGGGGAGAAATAIVANGLVTAVDVSDAGLGYTNPPVVEIAPPPLTALAGQTNSTLSLSGVTFGEAGEYCLVVTNAYGSVTSSVVTLTVVPPPLLNASVVVGPGLKLQIQGIAGNSYVLLSATSLAPPVLWTPVITNVADVNGNWTFTDTNVVTGAARFYRMTTTGP